MLIKNSKMKINYSILIIAALIIIQTSSCDDILIDSLEEQKVELVTPPNNFTTLNQTQYFFWETMEDATEYELRIAYPNFENPIEIVVNETLTENNYSVSLLPGTYEWRVKASNNASSTKEFEVRTLHILTDSTLTNQTVNILSPNDNLLTNDGTISILWQPLVLAGRYRVQVAQPDFSHSSFIIMDDTTNNDFYTLNLTEGNYQMRVRAENAQSNSNYSLISFEIDQTAPTVPVLTTPTDNDTSTTSIQLEWTSDATASLDTVYVYQDAQFLNLYQKYRLNLKDYCQRIYLYKILNILMNLSLFITG